MAKEREVRDDPHRQIVPEAQDEQMFLWLESLFELTPRTEAPPQGAHEHKPKSEPDNFPEKVELRPVFGRGGRDIGKPILHKDWKPMQSPVPSREALVQLANEFLSRAQGDCNGLRHPQRYALFAFSKLKGADHYARYLFALAPTGKEYTDKDSPATDDEDTHRDRLLTTSLAHFRWNQEHFAEAMSGVLKMQNEIIRQQRDEIAQMSAERRVMILATEEALSKKQEREEKAEMARLKREAIAWGMTQIQSFLPALKIYLTKGKLGVSDGLKTFFEGLSDEQKLGLFGQWDQERCIKPGILDQEQCQLFGLLLGGNVDEKRVSEFILSLRPEQLGAAQEILRPDQVQSLWMIAKAVTDVVAKENAEAGAGAGAA